VVQLPIESFSKKGSRYGYILAITAIGQGDLALRVVFNVSLGFKEFRGNKRAEPE
jgi:hypothetical protein